MRTWINWHAERRTIAPIRHVSASGKALTISCLARLSFLMVVCITIVPAPAFAADEILSPVQAAVRLANGGFTLWMRHAETVPGTGDPANFDLSDCATQRNLSEAGREQSRAVGAAFNAAGIEFASVAYSRWCRCRETAELAFTGAKPQPLLDSVFAGRGDGRDRARELATVLNSQSQSDSTNRMWVTHQVNITAATGLFTRQGDIVATRLEGDQFKPVFMVRIDG